MDPSTPPPPPPPPPPAGGTFAHADLDATTSLLVPVGVDGFALAAGYLALLSPLAVVLGIPTIPWGFRLILGTPPLLAVILGVVAVQRIRGTQGSRGLFRAWFGVVVPSIFFAIAMVILVMLGKT